MWTARISVPRPARRGDVVEIRTLVQHVMETGFRYDHLGQIVPRDILNRLVCTLDGEEVFRAELFPSIAANPYVSFFLIAERSGELVVTWTDDAGRSHSAHAQLVVA